MRRSVALALALLVTSIWLPARADAVTDSHGPACADIKGRDGAYNVIPGPGPDGSAQFHFAFTLADAPCKQATYFLHVRDSSGAIRTATYPAGLGDDPLTLCDTNRLCYDHNFGVTPGGPATVSVSGETRIGAPAADTAPEVDYVLCDA